MSRYEPGSSRGSCNTTCCCRSRRRRRT
jgi:hypothetical protein